MTIPSRSRSRCVWLLTCAFLAGAAGCQRDDTVRGAGSIDIPKESLKYHPTAKATTSKSQGKSPGAR